MDVFGPLFQAVEAGDLESVQAALAQGADPNAEDNRGMRLLHIAAAAGQSDTVNLLVASGAEVNGRDRWQATALWWSAAKGQAEIIDLLIALGADVNAVNDRGVSPLFAALSEGQIEAVNLLLAMGADPRTPEYDGGRTPLHIAAARGEMAVCSLLVAAGADPMAKDLGGATAADLAQAAGYGAVVQMLGVGTLSAGGTAAGSGAVAWSEPAGAATAALDRSPHIDLDEAALEEGPPGVAAQERAGGAAAPERIRLTVQGLPDALDSMAPTAPAASASDQPDEDLTLPPSPKPVVPFRYAPAAGEAEAGALPEMPSYAPGAGQEAESAPRRAALGARPVPPRGLSPDSGEEEMVPFRRRRRSPVATAVLGLLVLAVAAGGLWLYQAEVRSFRQAEPTPAATPPPTLPPIPPSSGLVNDRAGILDPTVLDGLEKTLRQVRERMSIEVLLVAVASVEPRSIDVFAADVASSRAVSGIRPTVLLSVVRDQTWFVAAGTGLEQVLTEQRIAEIRERAVKPNFDRRDFAAGTRAAAAAVVELLEQNYQVLSATKRAEEMATIRELNLTPDRAVYATPTHSGRPLKSIIVTHPRGAAIIIDQGKTRGFAPLTVELSPGTHSVHIWWQGRLPRAEKIVVTQEGATFAFSRDGGSN